MAATRSRSSPRANRVIGASGSLTGFAGGLAAKQYLLALEGRQSLALDL